MIAWSQVRILPGLFLIKNPPKGRVFRQKCASSNWNRVGMTVPALLPSHLLGEGFIQPVVYDFLHQCWVVNLAMGVGTFLNAEDV